MKGRTKRLIQKAVCIAAVLAGFGMAFNVYASSSYNIGSSLTQMINEWGVCKQTTNNTGKGAGVFVPTNTASEWNLFRSLAQGIGLADCYTYSWQTGGWGSCSVSCGGGTQSRSVWCQRSDGATVADGFCAGGKPGTSQACNTQSCCAGNMGTGCSGPANACGQTNSGTIQCDGSCSAGGAPGLPAGYGNGCSSAPNSCGQTNGGTIQCDGSCSAGGPPADPPPRYVCGPEYCANSDLECDSGGYNCEYVCVDWERNCDWVPGC